MSEKEIRKAFEAGLEKHSEELKKWIISVKAKLRCGIHGIELEPPEFICPECEALRDNYIRKLKEEGWADRDFRRAGWKHFEHIKGGGE